MSREAGHYKNDEKKKKELLTFVKRERMINSCEGYKLINFIIHVHISNFLPRASQTRAEINFVFIHK